MTYDYIPFIKLNNQNQDLMSVLQKVVNKGVFMNGEYHQKFKLAFARYLNVENVILTANCTDSLEIILRSINISPNDEVITAAFSWYSDASVVKIVGAKLVFCDINPAHFMMDFNHLKSLINSNTKAIILPHLFGQVHPEIEAIASFCKENGILLIEDCAQAHGASLNEIKAGAFGDIAAFSFYPTKNLGALGDGGAIVTNDQDLAESCYLWANHGQIKRDEHIQLGRNSRMDELQAAILQSKLPDLDAENQKRIEFAKIYQDILRQLNGISLPIHSEGHVYHQFVIKTEKRDSLKSHLKNKGIETQIHYPNAISDMDVFDRSTSCPNATNIADIVLSLPIHPNHTKEEIKYVANAILTYFKT
ncbi:DegT/DnrJ/EryC1/StrS family aminotransferase [Marivirga arenosa]|uniref:DegT/DnrJ/EryC1/StrS family aminotransferase n=1 Tax=Marivirga arenosa TaxID=3059076 RepID=A0AA52F1B5_9BACT|nr:DegT/DnrJ/EryC1/StrS family aminotransferase [Marivirga sp. BKB1-2]WNB18818.1 DegT/DnrJ/EryC1/StrS family aminotransferase [Marivirga sp. BKB1-2]